MTELLKECKEKEKQMHDCRVWLNKNCTKLCAKEWNQYEKFCEKQEMR